MLLFLGNNMKFTFQGICRHNGGEPGKDVEAAMFRDLITRIEFWTGKNKLSLEIEIDQI